MRRFRPQTSLRLIGVIPRTFHCPSGFIAQSQIQAKQSRGEQSHHQSIVFGIENINRRFFQASPESRILGREPSLELVTISGFGFQTDFQTIRVTPLARNPAEIGLHARSLFVTSRHARQDRTPVRLQTIGRHIQSSRKPNLQRIRFEHRHHRSVFHRLYIANIQTAQQATLGIGPIIKGIARSRHGPQSRPLAFGIIPLVFHLSSILRLHRSRHIDYAHAELGHHTDIPGHVKPHLHFPGKQGILFQAVFIRIIKPPGHKTVFLIQNRSPQMNLPAIRLLQDKARPGLRQTDNLHLTSRGKPVHPHFQFQHIRIEMRIQSSVFLHVKAQILRIGRHDAIGRTPARKMIVRSGHRLQERVAAVFVQAAAIHLAALFRHGHSRYQFPSFAEHGHIRSVLLHFHLPRIGRCHTVVADSLTFGPVTELVTLQGRSLHPDGIEMEIQPAPGNRSHRPVARHHCDWMLDTIKQSLDGPIVLNSERIRILYRKRVDTALGIFHYPSPEQVAFGHFGFQHHLILISIRTRPLQLRSLRHIRSHFHLVAFGFKVRGEAEIFRQTTFLYHRIGILRCPAPISFVHPVQEMITRRRLSRDCHRGIGLRRAETPAPAHRTALRRLSRQGHLEILLVEERLHGTGILGHEPPFRFLAQRIAAFHPSHETAERIRHGSQHHFRPVLVGSPAADSPVAVIIRQSRYPDLALLEQSLHLHIRNDIESMHRIGRQQHIPVIEAAELVIAQSFSPEFHPAVVRIDMLARFRTDTALAFHRHFQDILV